MMIRHGCQLDGRKMYVHHSNWRSQRIRIKSITQFTFEPCPFVRCVYESMHNNHAGAAANVLHRELGKVANQFANEHIIHNSN